MCGSERLTNSRHQLTIDRNGCRSVRRVDQDRTGSGFCGAGGIGSRRFGASSRECRLVDRGRRRDRARWIVGGDDDYFRRLVLFDNLQDFFSLLIAKTEIGRRQQVTKREGIADVTHRNGEIAAGALAIAGQDEILDVEQGGHVLGRNFDIAEAQRRHVERAVDDHPLSPVGEGDEKVISNDLDVVHLDAWRQFDDAVLSWGHPDSLRGHCGRGRERDVSVCSHRF